MTTKRPDAVDREVHVHKFGVIEFRTRGAGVFSPSEKLRLHIQSLSRDELRDANNAAWKARRKAERDCARYSAAKYGFDAYDRAGHSASVAKSICDATWRAMRGEG